MGRALEVADSSDKLLSFGVGVGDDRAIVMQVTMVDKANAFILWFLLSGRGGIPCDSNWFYEMYSITRGGNRICETPRIVKHDARGNQMISV